MLAFHMGLTIWVDIHVQGHGVAADRAVLDVVLASASGNIHGYDDFLAAGIADVGGLQVGGEPYAAAFVSFLRHHA